MVDLNCKSCKHWRFIRLNYGECHTINADEPNVENNYELPDDKMAVLWLNVAILNDDGESETVSEDKLSVDNSLITKENFGCVLYEPR